MEFYEAAARRRTVRDFTGQALPLDVLRRILEAGLQAPTNDHRRDWEFVVLRGQGQIRAVLERTPFEADKQLKNVRANDALDDLQRAMYNEAVPKQYAMLVDSGCLVLPFFRQRGDLLRPASLSGLNAFASIWCCIENILLAATAEGLGCSLRIPTGDEGEHVARAVNAPGDYQMPCYLGIGYPATDGPIVHQPPVDLARKIHMGAWSGQQ